MTVLAGEADAADQAEPGEHRWSLRSWELLPATACAVVLVVVALRAVRDLPPLDFEPYWHGVRLAWRRGDPFGAHLWLGTPAAALFLGPLAALSLATATWVVGITNVAVAAVLLGVAHRWLRPRTGPGFAWVVTFALACWAPLAVSLWYKQLNLAALLLAVIGFAALRRHPTGAGTLIGLSIALKPLLLLLPLFLVARARTRRAGVVAIGVVVATTAAGLLALQLNGGDGSPASYWHWFSVRSGVSSTYGCSAENTAPSALACRAFGSDAVPTAKVVVTVVVVLLAVGAAWWARRAEPESLLVLALAGILSPLLGPLRWSHYGVTLAPALLWVAAVAYARPRRWWLWLGLATTYGLAALVWSPAMTLPGQVQSWFGGGAETLAQSLTARRLAAGSQLVAAIAVLLAGRSLPLRGASDEPAVPATSS